MNSSTEWRITDGAARVITLTPFNPFFDSLSTTDTCWTIRLRRNRLVNSWHLKRERTISWTWIFSSTLISMKLAQVKMQVAGLESDHVGVRHDCDRLSLCITEEYGSLESRALKMLRLVNLSCWYCPWCVGHPGSPHDTKFMLLDLDANGDGSHFKNSNEWVHLRPW